MKPSTSALTLSALGTMLTACEPCLDLQNGNETEKTLANHVTLNTGADYSSVQSAICEVSQDIQNALGRIKTGDGQDADLFQVALGFGEQADTDSDNSSYEATFRYGCNQEDECSHILEVTNADYYTTDGPWEGKIESSSWRLNTYCDDYRISNGTDYLKTMATYYLADGTTYESASGEYPCWETTTIDSLVIE